VRHWNSKSNSSATLRQSSLLLLCRRHRCCRCCLGDIVTGHVFLRDEGQEHRSISHDTRLGPQASPVATGDFGTRVSSVGHIVPPFVDEHSDEVVAISARAIHCDARVLTCTNYDHTNSISSMRITTTRTWSTHLESLWQRHGQHLVGRCAGGMTRLNELPVHCTIF